MSIAENIERIRKTLPAGTRLLAVSKFHPAEALQEAYSAGQRLFGESRVQELTGKQEILPKDIEWHFIGHLQTNKIKYIIPYIHTIHSIDSWKLLQEIDRQAERCRREKPVDCLLQLHVAREETKFGFTPDEVFDLLRSGEVNNLSHIRLTGIMAMASNVEDESRIRSDFHEAASCMKRLKEAFFSDVPSFKELSMGMSHDYPIAIEEGSTLVRVGSSIFGERG